MAESELFELPVGPFGVWLAALVCADPEALTLFALLFVPEVGAVCLGVSTACFLSLFACAGASSSLDESEDDEEEAALLGTLLAGVVFAGTLLAAFTAEAGFEAAAALADLLIGCELAGVLAGDGAAAALLFTAISSSDDDSDEDDSGFAGFFLSVFGAIVLN